MRIALDAMGGDLGPSVAVAGAVKAIIAATDLSVALVGPANQLEGLLAQHGADVPRDRLDIVHAADVVSMAEKPADALRRKSDTSIARCWQLLADKKWTAW